MRGLLILGAVLLVLFLLGQLKIGSVVEYGEAGLTVRVRLGPARLTVYPRQPKAKRKKEPKKKQRKKERKKKQEEPKQSEMPRGGALGLAKELLPLALEAAAGFKRRLVADRLELRLTAGAPDPADAALLYGRANAALGALWLPLTECFQVRDGRAHVEVDFARTAMDLYALAELSLRLWQLLWLVLFFGAKALSRYMRYRRQQRKIQQERKAV